MLFIKLQFSRAQVTQVSNHMNEANMAGNRVRYMIRIKLVPTAPEVQS